MISFLYFQHFPQYFRSSQQCSLLHHPNILCYPYVIFSIHLLNSFVTLPTAPITTGTSFHNLPISLFESWYFPLSPFLFPLLLHQVVQQYWWLSLFALSYQLQLCLVFLPLSCCHTEHWYPTTLSLLRFLLLLLGRVDTTFLCVLTHSSYKGPNGLTLLPYCVVSYILSEQISHNHLLSVCCIVSYNLHRRLSLVLPMWCFT